MTDREPWAGHEFATSVAGQDRLKQRCLAMYATMQAIMDDLLDGSGNSTEYTAMQDIQRSADRLYNRACQGYSDHLAERITKLELIIDGLVQ